MSDEQGKNEPLGDGDDVVEPYDVDEQPGVEPEPEPVDVNESESDSASEPGEASGSGSAEAVEASPAASPKKTGPSVSARVERWRVGAAGEGEALSRPGALGWKFFVVMSVGALIAAVVLSVMNRSYAEDATFWQKLGPGALEALRVLLRAPVHLSIGMLAFALTAWAVGVRAGRGDLAAARIGLAVSLVIMSLQLQWDFPGQRVVAYLIALTLYFTTVLFSFRCPARVVGTLLVLHIGLFAAIAGLGWLIVWIGL